MHISNKIELNTYVHICSRIYFEVHISICVELTYIYVDVSTLKYPLIFVLNGQTGWTCTRRKLDKPCRTDSTSRIKRPAGDFPMMGHVPAQLELAH